MPTSSPRVDHRERILDAALRLMSDRGAANTSMRQLAAACELNVAVLYRYFPSKEDLLRSVIEERQYEVLLRQPPVADFGQPPRQRLEALLVAMWDGSEEEEAVWKLLLGESFRGDPHALTVGSELLALIEDAVAAWLPKLFPELALDGRVATRVLLGQLFALFIETQFVDLPDRDPAARREHVRRRASDVAAAFFPSA